MTADLDGDTAAAHALCRSLNGSCRCAATGLGPCQSLIDLIENDEDIGDERARMERGRHAADEFF